MNQFNYRRPSDLPAYVLREGIEAVTACRRNEISAEQAVSAIIRLWLDYQTRPVEPIPGLDGAYMEPEAHQMD